VAAITDQVFKQIEDLRLNGHSGVPAAELAPPGIEDVIIEKKNQPSSIGAFYLLLIDVSLAS
jgi:hypothetical protein